MEGRRKPGQVGRGQRDPEQPPPVTATRSIAPPLSADRISAMRRAARDVMKGYPASDPTHSLMRAGLQKFLDDSGRWYVNLNEEDEDTASP